MEKYLFVKPLLCRFAEERFLRQLFAWALRILAFVVAIAGLVSFFLDWKGIFELTGEAVIGGVFYQMFFLLTVYMVAHVMLIRAAQIGELPAGELPAAAISTVLLRAAGEVYALAAAGLGIGAGIFIWSAGKGAGRILSPLSSCFPFLQPGSGSFLAGGAVLFQGLSYGLALLLISYLLAELVSLLCRPGQRPASVAELGESLPSGTEEPSGQGDETGGAVPAKGKGCRPTCFGMDVDA